MRIVIEMNELEKKKQYNCQKKWKVCTLKAPLK